MNLFLHLCLLSSFIMAEAAPTKQKNECRKTVLSHLNEKTKHQFPHFSFVNKDAPKGGTLVLSNQGTFDGLNMFTIKGSYPREVLPLAYQGLMYRSPDEAFVMYPLLAKEVSLKDDYSSITYYLDERATFSDGSPVLSTDVKETFEKLHKSIPRYKNIFSKVKSITCINERTIQIDFNPMACGTYDVELPLVVSMVPILKASSIKDIELKEPSFKPVIGSGPYVLDTFEQGRFVQMKKRDNYWAKDYYKGFYNFDTIRVDYYKNTQAQFQAFQSGAFDAYFETNPQNWRRSYNFDAIKSGKVVRIDKEHKRSVMARYFIVNLRKPLFQDIELRKALALASDPDSINRLVYEGDMKVPNSTFSNTIYAHQGKAEGIELQTLERYKDKIGCRFDEIVSQSYMAPTTKQPTDHRPHIEKADALLTKAGYLLKDGVRLTKDGKPLQISIMIKDEKLEKLGIIYQQNLKKLGIQLTIQRMDTVQYENKVIESDFDMIIHAISNGVSPGIEQVYYYSTKTADEKGSSNYVGFKDPVLEELAKNILKAKNKDEHIAFCRAMDRYLMHQYCFIPLIYDNKYRASYWIENFDVPEYDPSIGTDIIAFGWSKK